MFEISHIAGARDLTVLAAAGTFVILAVQFAARLRPVLAGPAVRYDSWKVLGPGGGGSDVTATAVSPHDPATIVVASEMTGTYISHDSGNFWRMINFGQVVYAVAFDPTNQDVIYAGSIFLWRSDDRGKIWRRVYPSASKEVSFCYQGDHAFHLVSARDPSYPRGVERVFVSAVAVDPRVPGTIFISHKGDYRQTVPAAALITRDAGDNWDIIGSLGDDIISCADIDPETSEVTFAGQQALYTYDGRGMERIPAPYGNVFNCVCFGRRAGSLCIYAAVGADWDNDGLRRGLIVSHDRGRTWREIAGGLGMLAVRRVNTKVPQFRAVSCCATKAEVVYAGFKNLVMGSPKDDVYNGIARSNDSGATWRVVKREKRLASLEPVEAYQRRRLPAGNIWFDEPAHIAVAPGDPNLSLASDLFRTLISRDGGRSWRSANASETSDGRFVTKGIDSSVCFGVRFDPFDSNNMYAFFGNLGIWNSADKGKTWRALCEGVPLEWRRCSYWLELDPRVRGLAWAAVSGTHDLPRPKMWRRRSVSTYRGGVLVTTDGGESWTPATCETEQMAITHILLDPRSPVGKRTLYACGFGRGVLKSTDNGRTWVVKATGIEFEEPFAWRLAMAADGALYLVVARRHEWGESRPSGIGALYRSTDSAENWERLPLPETVDGPTCLCIDPSDAARMYLASWGRYTGKEDVGGGVFVTADGGNTWHKSALDDLHVYDVTIDPRGNVLYAVGFESSAYRSLDRGMTWRRIRGYNFKWGHRVVPDPADENMVFIATFGGGIWYGPAAGDPRAAEDLLTPIEKAKCD